MNNLDLTICTVSHSRTHTPLLSRNWEITRELNPNNNYRWIVVENIPPDSKERLGLEGSKFDIVQGIKKPEHKFGVCYHAARAFMIGLKEVKTRFVLILDPDLFIVRENWMDLMISYMKNKDLAFFGTPIYPNLYHKWRYFPCTQLMMIDLDKTGRDLDFTPRYELKYDLYAKKSDQVNQENKQTKLKLIKEQLRLMLKRGSIIDSSFDTVWQIAQDYKNRPHLYECVQPVLKLNEQPFKPKWINSTWNRFIEKFLPDKWCFIPKQKNYYTERGFKERGHFDTAKFGWDETIFEDQPFSFHMRGMLSDASSKDHQGELPALEAAIISFIKKRA